MDVSEVKLVMAELRRRGGGRAHHSRPPRRTVFDNDEEYEDTNGPPWQQYNEPLNLWEPPWEQQGQQNISDDPWEREPPWQHQAWYDRLYGTMGIADLPSNIHAATIPLHR